MEQYIPKSALVAELKKRKIIARENAVTASDNNNVPVAAFWSGKENICNELLSVLDNLEVKEMDLEDSVKETLAQKYIDYTLRRYDIDSESKEGQLIYYAFMHGMNQCLDQLKAQKGE